MTQPTTASTRPLLVELDPDAWARNLERVSPWLGSAATLQATFRRLAEGVADGVDEPHIRAAVTTIADDARRHEAVFEDVYAAFGIRPARRPRVAVATGAVAAGAISLGRQVAAQVVGRLAGSHGRSWRGIRELLRSNLDAIGGFGVVQQLGLALGNPHVVDLVLPVLREKQKHQLLLQEYFLEMAPNAILYHRDA